MQVQKRNFKTTFPSLQFTKNLYRFSTHSYRKRNSTKWGFLVIDSIDDLSVYTYSIDLVKGITFHNVSGFYQTNEMVGCFSKQVKESIKDYIEYNVATNYVIQQPNGSEIFK